MMRYFFTAVLIAASSPALALRVSNLDEIPHTITYDSAGTVQEFTVDAGETINLPGLPNGFLSLKSQNPKPSKGILNADGMLSGVVGAVRDQNIPADRNDDFAIWPDGKLLLQRHIMAIER